MRAFKTISFSESGEYYACLQSEYKFYGPSSVTKMNTTGWPLSMNLVNTDTINEVVLWKYFYVEVVSRLAAIVRYT